MNDIMEVIKSLESGLLIKDVKQLKMKEKNKKLYFLASC